MLRVTEEIVLLLLRDDGSSLRVPPSSLRYAIAGGVLMDLAVENRIDTDLRHLLLIDATPVGDELLDPTLADVAASAEAGEDHDSRHWVEHVATSADAIHAGALNRLVERGILERREGRILWAFRSRRYPVIAGEVTREVKLRILEVLFSDDIPDPRDVMIICLADACDVFGEMLSAREVAQVTPRIEQVRRLELIGHAVSGAIDDIGAAIAAAVAQHMY